MSARFCKISVSVMSIFANSASSWCPGNQLCPASNDQQAVSGWYGGGWRIHAKPETYNPGAGPLAALSGRCVSNAGEWEALPDIFSLCRHVTEGTGDNVQRRHLCVGAAPIRDFKLVDAWPPPGCAWSTQHA